MTKQIKEYLAHLEEYFSHPPTPTEDAAERAAMLCRISFYQHERLVHLFVLLGPAADTGRRRARGADGAVSRAARAVHQALLVS